MKVCAIVLCSLFLAGHVFAEEIVLNNGMTVQGKITELSAKRVKVNANGVDVTYYMDEIRSIDGKPVSIPKAAETKLIKPASLPEPEKAPEVLKSPQALVEQPVEQMAPPAEQTKISDDQSHVQNPQDYSAQDSAPYSSGEHFKSKTMTAAKMIGVILVTLVMVSMIFILVCYPVFLIAKKTNTANPYFAFIPILNYYLLCKMAGRPVWWVILYIIPLVNIIIDVIVWMGIAKLRHKPSWLGVLSLVPLANLGMMWYLALSDQPSL